MSKNNKIIDCPFCNMDMTKLENTIIEETKYLYVTPSLGSMVDGYILIISKRHVNSMLELNDKELLEYNMLIDKYREIFKHIYTKYPIVFEHGTPNLEGKMKASSIIHAHTHLVNHNYNSEVKMLQELNFKKIRSIYNIISKNNYIFYINPNNEKFVSYKFKSISQLMRIEIAKDLNLLDEYDWYISKYDDNILLTVTKINDYFNQERGN